MRGATSLRLESLRIWFRPLFPCDDGCRRMAEHPRRRLPSQQQVFFIALLILVFFLTWIVFKPFIIFMITGVFVAVLALPIDRFWERVWWGRSEKARKRQRGNRIAAACSMLSIFLIITVPIALLGLALVGDAQNAVQAIQNGKVEDSIDGMLDVLPWTKDQNATERNETLDAIWGWVQPKAKAALDDIVGGAAGFLGRLFVGVTIVLFVTYYVLTDGDRLVQYLKRALPLPDSQVTRMLKEAHGGLRAVFFGQIVTSLIQGALGGIGFLIAGVPGAIIWAAVMAILSLLPVVGAFLVWIPAAIFLLATGQIWQGIFLTAWGFILVSQVDNFVRPKLIGDRADIHPLFVLVGVLGGVAAWGFIGLFLGPLLVGITISVLRVWEAEYLDPALIEAPLASSASIDPGMDPQDPDEPQ